jgi:hypothetical protein
MLQLTVAMSYSGNISNFIILAKQNMSTSKIPKERLPWRIFIWLLTIIVVWIQLQSTSTEMINSSAKMCSNLLTLDIKDINLESFILTSSGMSKKET